tara:strand:+ start:55 stop:255 length:201 start_codon:yes stop_codon:yes gene_type:complete
MKKEYKFKAGFSIKTRAVPDGAFCAMGEMQVSESILFDLYLQEKFIETLETFEEARELGMQLIKNP